MSYLNISRIKNAHLKVYLHFQIDSKVCPPILDNQSNNCILAYCFFVVKFFKFTKIKRCSYKKQTKLIQRIMDNTNTQNVELTEKVETVNQEVSLDAIVKEYSSKTREELVERLLEYSKYKKYSEILMSNDENNNDVIERKPSDFIIPFADSELWENVTVQDLLSVSSKVLYL